VLEMVGLSRAGLQCWHWWQGFLRLRWGSVPCEVSTRVPLKTTCHAQGLPKVLRTEDQDQKEKQGSYLKRWPPHWGSQICEGKVSGDLTVSLRALSQDVPCSSRGQQSARG